MPHLVVHDPGGVAVALVVTSGARVGRDAACDVVLSDGKVSRHHATFERADDGWWLVDAGSRHGSWLNGARVDRARLTDGDRIQIGLTVVTFGVADAVSEVVVRRTAELEPGTARGVATAEARLAVFYGLAEAARSLADRDAVLRRALASVVETVGAERGLFALAASVGATPRRVAELRGADVVVGRALVDATGRGEAVLVRERSVSATAGAPSTLHAQGIRCAMAAPVHVGGRVAGFVYVDHRDEDRFGAADLALLSALATLAGAIVDAAARVEQAEARAEAAALIAPPPVIVGASAPVLALRRDVERLGAVDLAVHVTGETGVGKELIARAVHAASRRAAAPLVAVNCAALPDTLLESELFGYVRGAFTGATSARRGRFALADGGTLFLDEIADLSLAAQAKILRVLEDGEVTPVGGERTVRVDVRVLSASHKDLRREVEAGRFREDLFYRVVVAELPVPPLRARTGDVALLAESFLAAARARGARVTSLSPDAAAALAAHAWPGNVRELRNVIERAAALATGARIELDDLRLTAGPRTAAAPAPAAPTSANLADQFAALDVTERRLVEDAMTRAGGNVAEAARLLGITRIMMKRRLDRYAGGGADE